MKPLRPSVFLVGAQKCGTTSLAQYLGEHPQLFFCSPKEPFYFATDFPGLRRVEDEAEYLSLFEAAPPGVLRAGEATAGYLRSREAVRNIRAFDPGARLIVMLRSPLELVPSFHSQMLFGFDEDEEDFPAAWSRQDDRRAGRALPPRCRVPEFLDYRDAGLLGRQLESLLQVFPRDQVHWIFFEDFKRDTRGCYLEVLDFLQIEDDGRQDFPRMNPAKRHRFPALMALLSRRPAWVQRGIERLKLALGPHGLARVQDLYSSRTRREALPEALEVEMKAAFRDDVALLSELTGRDLGHWVA